MAVKGQQAAFAEPIMSGMPIKFETGSVRTGTGSKASETLAGIAIFRDLAPDVVAALARRCRWRRYGPSQTILQRRDESRDVFFIVRGRVAAVYHSASGREVRFCDLAAGEIFGEFAAMDGAPRSADIVAVTDSLIASMSADAFWEVLRRHEPVCAAMLRRLTGIARTHLQRVVEFSTLSVRSRIHAELLRLAGSSLSGPAADDRRHRAGADPRRDREPHQHAPRSGHAGARRARARQADREARERADHPRRRGARELGRGVVGGTVLGHK